MTLRIRSSRILRSGGALPEFAPGCVVIEGAFIKRIDWMNEATATIESSEGGGGGSRDPLRASPEGLSGFLRDDALEGAAVGETVLDVEDRVVTPAFVNAHTHLSLGALRGRGPGRASSGNLVEDFFFRIERRLCSDDVRAFARMGAYESLLHGVGMVWDHYYYADAMVEALLDVGLTAVFAPTLQDLAGPGVSQLDAQLEATERIAHSEQLAQRGIFAALGAHATDTVSGDLWMRIAREADRLGIPVHSHAAQSAEECLRALRRHGKSPLAWLRDLGALDHDQRTVLVHCLLATEDDLAVLNRQRTTLGFCPYAQRVFGFPADPRRWERAGLDWFVATDTSAGNDSMNLQKELRAVAELRTTPTTYAGRVEQYLDREHSGMASKVANREEQLRQILAHRDETFAAAEGIATPGALLSRVWEIPGAMHPAVKAGVLEQGALANLLVWDTDHPSFWPAQDVDSVLQSIAMGDTTSALHAVVVGGRIVGEVGDYSRSLVGSEMYRAAKEEADARLVSLLA